MTVTLNIKPELETELVVQAEANGMKLEEYVLSLLERALLSNQQGRMSAEQRAAAFEAWSESHSRDTPLLSDYAVSREGIYDGRER